MFTQYSLAIKSNARVVSGISTSKAITKLIREEIEKWYTRHKNFYSGSKFLLRSPILSMSSRNVGLHYFIMVKLGQITSHPQAFYDRLYL